MSIYTHYELCCNGLGCYKNFVPDPDAEPWPRTPAQLRKAAAGQGWKRERNGLGRRYDRDYCPGCSPPVPEKIDGGEFTADGLPVLHCPVCQHRTEVSEDDPDAALSSLWEHLQTHDGTREKRRMWFIRAQQPKENGK